MKSFDYIIGASAVALGFAAYFAYFVGVPPTTTTLVIVGTIWTVLLTILNLAGMKEASGINNLLVVLKVAALVLFIAVGATFLFQTGDFSNYHPFFPTGISGVLSGAAIIFFAFIGFNTIAVIAEEVKDPEKNVPKAILLSFWICTALYIGVSIVAVGLVSWQALGASAAPLELALRQATQNPYILGFIALSALFATTSVIVSSIIGGSRALFAMARQGVIPRRLSRISKRGIPILTVLICGVTISLIVLFTNGNLDLLASIFNFGTLLTFFFINASCIRLRMTRPDAERKFHVPFYPVTPLLGLGSCMVLAVFLNINSIVAGAGWIAVGILAYMVNQRRTKAEPPAERG
jgi:APA family basic amino acid/polyamine antiporter